MHAPIAEKAGLDAAAVEALRTGATPHFDQEDEQAVWRFAHHLLHDHEVPDATYRTVEDLLGAAATVELVGIARLLRADLHDDQGVRSAGSGWGRRAVRGLTVLFPFEGGDSPPVIKLFLHYERPRAAARRRFGLRA